MSDSPIITPKKSVERAAREARLAKALRENLVRRKEQKRAQEGRTVPQSQAPGRKREPPTSHDAQRAASPRAAASTGAGSLPA